MHMRGRAGVSLHGNQPLALQRESLAGDLLIPNWFQWNVWLASMSILIFMVTNRRTRNMFGLCKSPDSFPPAFLKGLQHQTRLESQ